jgi:hypothetical protein
MPGAAANVGDGTNSAAIASPPKQERPKNARREFDIIIQLFI